MTINSSEITQSGKLLREYKIQSIDLIQNYEHNSRTHSEEQIQEVVNSIKRYGYTNPILVDENNTIIAGHCRIIGAKRAGMVEIPTIIIDGLTDVEKAELVICDNKLALNAGWDFNILADQITFIRDNGGSVEATGFKPDELLTFMPQEVPAFLGDEDDVPDAPAEPITKRGDVWILGRHKLMCGDSTMIDDVEKLLAGEKADICFTSPPYNGNTHLDYGNGKNKPLYENDNDAKSSDDYVKFCQDALSNIFLAVNGFVFWNVNYNSKSRFEYIKGIYSFIDRLWETIIWKKTGMPVSNGLTRNYEFIFCFKSNTDKKHLNKEFKTEFNVWEISNINSQDKESHRACFPVELPQKAIELASRNNDIVLDLFGGSGSTLIACEKTNRRCYMMELSERYCDVIVKRWEQFTGKKAELENERI